ncbi:nucleoside-diphosphate-sugar epimerase [Herbihabitans rhizosphaerae]|uniref:Nucleoside-diphosphate-sugar epimerase n=1 Tax=Herbihabitans rhizosphaerae TaxID=1872711 RepID=A0A4Q7KGN4_9PSEU|nr:NAD(P)H-binding protein [Herbihabitans rhizosphaerae]RZS34018.1 nucleoside-diphosphate-sugar epimerase [Herbihabitans rhizosphaerae]
MRVLLIGSTGVLGREAVPRLAAAGHQVTGLARNDGRVPAVRALGIEPVVADVFDPDSLLPAMRGQDAVLNLATRIPVSARTALRGMKDNDHLRAEGSAAIVEAARASGDVRTIVQEGVSFMYADGGDTELDETAPVDVPKLLQAVMTAHENVAGFAGDGRTGVRLRIGLLVSGDPGTRMLVAAARRGLPTLPGDDDGWTLVIHPSDAAAGAVAALDAPSGVYNVGANPIRRGQLRKVIAEVARVRRVRRLPQAFAVGPLSVLGRSQRVVSHKLADATGWRPARPTITAAWLRGE